MPIYRRGTHVPFENLREMLRLSAKQYGDRIAFVQKKEGVDKAYTYRKFRCDVNELGTGLLKRGFLGKKIMLIGSNRYLWGVSYMAVICGLGVIVPIDPSFSPNAVAEIAKFCSADAVIYSEDCKEKLAMLDKKTVTVSFDEARDILREGRALMDRGDTSYKKLPIDKTEMCEILFTSGTEGSPKGVMLSHENFCSNIRDLGKMITMKKDDIVLALLPMHQAYQCTCGFLFPLMCGARVVFCDTFKYLIKNMQEYHPTIVFGVPPLLESIYKKIWNNIRRNGDEEEVRRDIQLTNALYPASTRAAVKHRVFSDIHKSFGDELRLFVVQGSHISSEIMKGMRDLGFLTIQSYGLTECSPIVAINREKRFRDASVGLALPGGVVDIYDVGDNGIGEIRYKGDNVMLGYYNMPELTAETKRGSWIYTGDLGYIDKNGFIYITGRKKNIIVSSSGKKILPDELESYLSRNRFIGESVVVGMVNPKKKDYDIVAVVRPNISALKEALGDDCTKEQIERELIAALRQINSSVPFYKRIDTYIIYDKEFPKNSARKIQRDVLRQDISDAYKKKIGLID
ncbi:MAG: AMP-binding protein [Clostridia bacterium]|nr:AMP-binding protein [Clostridia bacterium]